MSMSEKSYFPGGLHLPIAGGIDDSLGLGLDGLAGGDTPSRPGTAEIEKEGSEDGDLGKKGNRGNLIVTHGRLYNKYADNSHKAIKIDVNNGEIILDSKEDEPTSWLLDSVCETNASDAKASHLQDWQLFRAYFEDRIERDLPHMNVVTLGCEGSGKSNYLWGESEWESRGVIFRYLDYILDKSCKFHASALQFRMYVISDEEIIDILDNCKTYSYQGHLGHSNLLGSSCFPVRSLYLYNTEQAIILMMASLKCLAFALKSFDRPFNPAHIIVEFTMLSSKQNNVTTLRFVDVGHADTATINTPVTSDRFTGLCRANRSMTRLTGVLDVMKKAFKKKKKKAEKTAAIPPTVVGNNKAKDKNDADNAEAKKPAMDPADRRMFDTILNECCGSLLTYLLQDAFYMSPDCYVIICVKNSMLAFEDNKHYLDFANDLDVVSELSSERMKNNDKHGKYNLIAFLNELEIQLQETLECYQAELQKQREDLISVSETAINKKNREAMEALAAANAASSGGAPQKKKKNEVHVAGVKRSDVEKEVDRLLTQMEKMHKTSLVQHFKSDLNAFPLSYHCPVKKSTYYTMKSIYLYKQILFLQLFRSNKYFILDQVFNWSFQIDGQTAYDFLDRAQFLNNMQGFNKALDFEFVESYEELHADDVLIEELKAAALAAKAAHVKVKNEQPKVEISIKCLKVSIYDEMLTFLESRSLLENRIVLGDFIKKFYKYDTAIDKEGYKLMKSFTKRGDAVKKDQLLARVKNQLQDGPIEEIVAPKDGIITKFKSRAGTKEQDSEGELFDAYFVINSGEIEVTALVSSNNVDYAKLAELYFKFNNYEGPHLLFVSNRDVSDHIHTIPLYRGVTSFVQSPHPTRCKTMTHFPESTLMELFKGFCNEEINEGFLDSTKLCDDNPALSSRIWLFSNIPSTFHEKEVDHWHKGYDASMKRLTEIGYIPFEDERMAAKDFISVSQDGYFEVTVDSLGLEPIHCTIVQKFNRVIIHPSPLKSRDMALAEIYVNGVRVNSEVTVSDKDVIRMGKSLYFIVRIPGQTQSIAKSATLNVDGAILSSNERLDQIITDDKYAKGLWDAFSPWEFALAASYINSIRELIVNCESNRRMDIHFNVNRHITPVLVKQDKNELQNMNSYYPSREFVSLLIELIEHETIYKCCLLACATEASNIISKSLARGVTYELNFKLISDSLDQESFLSVIEIDQSKLLSPQHAHIVNPIVDGGSRKFAVLIKAMVDPNLGGGEWLWNPSIFNDRFNLFNEMMDCFRSHWCNSDLSMLDRFYPEKCDPFIDTLSEELIGASFIYLDSLLYLLDFDDTVPIIGFKGEEAGSMKVRVRCWIDKIEISPSYLSADKESHLKHFLGKTCIVRFYFSQLFGIPSKLCSTPFLRFNFYHYPLPFTTGKYNGNNVNPFLNSVVIIETKITNDFINFISTGSVEIEVKGRKKMPITEKLSLTQVSQMQLNSFPSELNRINIEFFQKILGERGVYTPQFFPYTEILVGEPPIMKEEDPLIDPLTGLPPDENNILNKILEQEKKEEAMQEEIQELQSELAQSEKEVNRLKKLLHQAEFEKQAVITKMKIEKKKELEAISKNINNIKENNSKYISKIKASIPRKKSIFSTVKTFVECDDATFLRELEEGNKAGCSVS